MRTEQRNPDAGRELLKFFDWVYHHGPKSVGVLEYVFIPESVVTLVQKSWEQIKGPDGVPVWNSTPPNGAGPARSGKS